MKSQQLSRIAYLVSKYPDFSHTFILREVLFLRSRGMEIEVASINNAPDASKLPEVEKHEAETTFYVKRSGAGGALRGALWMLGNRPDGLLRGLWFALRLGGTDISRILLCSFYWVEAVILAQWMHERKLSHIHVHFATPAASVALVLTQMSPVTMSMTVHGPDEFYDVPGYYLARKVEQAKFVLCISYFAQSQLMKIAADTSANKFDVVRLGVDTAHFAQRPLPDSETFTILCVGRLVSAKGQRILIQAVAELKAAGRNLRLELVGDGPDRDILEAQVKLKGLADTVSFAGIINQDNIRAFYQRADVFVLASFAEGIPVVLMEAMAMEIPCISTRIAGIPELIEDGVDGLLVAASDVHGLAAAIARVMDSEQLRMSLGKAGRLRVQREYELATNAEQLREVFLRRLETTA